MNITAKINWVIRKLNSAANNVSWLGVIYSRNARFVQHFLNFQCNSLFKGLKKKGYVIISINTDKALDKI